MGFMNPNIHGYYLWPTYMYMQYVLLKKYLVFLLPCCWFLYIFSLSSVTSSRFNFSLMSICQCKLFIISAQKVIGLQKCTLVNTCILT